MAGILSIQPEPIIDDRQCNLKKIHQFIEKNRDKKLDLVVLPEFFLTGISKNYTSDPEPIVNSVAINYLSELAKKYNTNIVCGSIVTRDNDGKVYNMTSVLDRSGKVVAQYRKIHLFAYLGGNENMEITEGREVVVAELDFAKVGLSICFDIKYPLHYKKLIQKGAEIIVSPSAWGYLTDNILEGKNMTELFRALNITRAAESLVYFITSNLTGRSGLLEFIGNSMITSPLGVVVQNAECTEGAIWADIDLDKVRELKVSYPIADID